MPKLPSWVLLGVGAWLLASGCKPAAPRTPAVHFTPSEIREILKLSPLPPLPPSPTNAFADNPQAAEFGHRLFFEKRLSKNGQVACATCHDPQRGFADDKPLSLGIGVAERHSQALWNVAYQRWFTWTGSADSLWAQAMQPLMHPDEMGASPEHVRSVLAGDPTLKSEYEAIFGPLPRAPLEDGTSADRMLSNLGKALEAYQRRIISKDSPFDRFVATLRVGDQRAAAESLGESAVRGLKLFIERGQCTLCHSGPNFSDGEFHNIGLPGGLADQGRFGGIGEVRADRFNGTGEFSDDRSEKTNLKLRYLTVKANHLGEFKTPTLRNAALTAPYMHDGRFATLREVLRFYSELPGEPIFGHREETLKPSQFTEDEITDLEAFIRSLSSDPADQSVLHPPAAELLSSASSEQKTSTKPREQSAPISSKGN